MSVKEISAGGVVYRGGGEATRIQMIRDRYGKITLAKGKMEAGETIEQTALREIAEETGIAGRIVEPIRTVSYTYTNPSGEHVDKVVHYYLVEALDGELQAQLEEIESVEWLPPDEAWMKQKSSGYANNDEVLRLALEKLGHRVE